MEKGVIKAVFDAAGLVITELNQEAEEIKIKFGDRSKLFLKKVNQISAIVNLYEAARKFISESDHLSNLQQIQIDLMIKLILNHELILPFEKIARIYGLDSSEMKRADDTLTNCLRDLYQILGDGQAKG